ncbi:MAG TPA: Mur ligase family protein, partial [bacterium]|nr:Mur ligase family protein [bacterium]
SSALVVTILKSGGLSPSFVIGGEICGLGNSEVGSGEYLIVEACEYRRSFLAYYPEIAVITSVEEDHLDYYRDLSEIQEAFGCFAARVRPEGALIVCAEDKRALHCAGAAVARVITYGFNGADWQAGSVTESAGGISFECFFRCEFFGSFSLPLLGRHNVLNALGAIAVGKELGLTAETLSRALASFPGVHRRLEKIAEVGEVIIMDDYGHHPTEIRATLLALRGRYPQRRVIVIFQPHQYSRTRFLLEDFAASFNLADKVIVPDIYFVRDSEREKQLVNAGMLAEKIRGHGRQALYLPTATEIIAYLKEIVKPGDLVITIGAGPINRVGWQFAQELQKKVLASPSLPEDLPAESKLT